MTTEIITQSELKQILRYEPETGIFFWIKATSKKILVGKRAGTLSDKGYERIAINKRLYRAHRLAWLYVYGSFPDEEIDHINGIKSDNRIKNLRASDRLNNNRNVGIKSNNTSGYKGVYHYKKSNKWMAKAKICGLIKYIGLFNTKEQAAFAYNNFIKEKHGIFYRNTLNN